MKKLALMLALVLLAVGIKAQDPKKTEHKKDYVVMKEGKMMVVKDGKTTALDKEMTLADGTRVMSDGKVMMKDGSTKLLRDGESIPLSGATRSKKEPIE
jgi:hypothetical protein